MAVEYALFENPMPSGQEGEPTLHARFIPNRTVRTRYLCQLVSGWSSFSSADIKGMLELLSNAIALCLEDGSNVQLDELGTFSLALQCRPDIHQNDKKDPLVQLGRVTFRNSNVLLDKMRKVDFIRKPNSGKKAAFTSDERKERLLTYLDEGEETVTRTTYMDLNRCSRYHALEELKELMVAGKIRQLGHGKAILYIRTSL